MSRKAWIAVGSAVLVLALLGVAGGLGVLWWQKSRVTEWHTRAQEEYAKGNWHMARNFYGRYLTKHPQDMDALMKYAEASAHIPDNREAALRSASVAYYQYLQYDRGNREVQDKLLDLYERMRSWPDVEHYAGLFLQERPDDPHLLYHVAHATGQTGDRSRAIEAFRELVARPDAPADAYRDLAALLVEEGKVEEADKVIADAVAARPNDLDIHLAAVYVYRRSDSPAGARRHLEAARRIAPDDAKVHLAAAQVAFQERNFAAATEEAEKAVVADPKNAEAIILLGHGYALRENPEKAVETLERLDRLQRADNPEAMILLADLLYGLNQIDKGQTYVDEYLNSNPGQEPMSDYFKARALLAAGDDEDNAQAATVLSEVAQKMPGFAPAQYFLAVAYLRSNQRSLGRSALEGYMAKNSSDTRAAALYAQEFGPPRSGEVVQKDAERVLASDEASASDLVNAAREVMRSLGKKPPKEETDVLVRLFEEALRRDPSLAPAYRALAEINLLSGNPAAARSALDRAAAAGLPESEFRLTRTNIALAEKDSDAARAQLDAALADPALKVRDVAEWATLLRSQGQPELSEYALTKGEERLGAEAEAALAVERALIAAVHSAPGDAIQAIEAAAAKAGQDTGLTRKLMDGRLEVARRLLLEGSPDSLAKARELVTAVRAQEPREPTALALEAQMLLKQTPPDVDGAQALLESVLQADGQNLVALMGLSEIEFRQGDPAAALNYADQAATVAPRAPAPALLRARLLMDLQRHLEAQSVLDAVLTEDPENAGALQLYTESCIASNRLDDARAFLNRLEAAAGKAGLPPSTVEGLRGKLMLAMGTPGEAESLLRRQYETDKDDLATLRNLATALAAQDRLDEVEELYKEYTDRHRDSAQAWIDLARIFQSRNTPEHVTQASDALTRALVIEPNNPQAIRDMIQVQIMKGNVFDALIWCNRYLDRDKSDPQVLHQKAMLLRQRGDLDGAIAALNQAIEASDQLEYRAARGLVYLQQQDYAKALQDLQQVAGGPRATTALVDLALAEAYAATAQAPLARQYFDSAREKANNQNQPVDPARMRAVEERVKALEQGSTPVEGQA